MTKKIEILGARENNLKNIDLEFNKNNLVVIKTICVCLFNFSSIFLVSPRWANGCLGSCAAVIQILSHMICCVFRWCHAGSPQCQISGCPSQTGRC